MAKKAGPMLSVIIAEQMGKKRGASKADSSSSESDAGEEILSAIKDEDAEALGAALKSFVMMCMNDYGDGDDDADEDAA